MCPVLNEIREKGSVISETSNQCHQWPVVSEIICISDIIGNQQPVMIDISEINHWKVISKTGASNQWHQWPVVSDMSDKWCQHYRCNICVASSHRLATSIAKEVKLKTHYTTIIYT